MPKILQFFGLNHFLSQEPEMTKPEDKKFCQMVLSKDETFF